MRDRVVHGLIQKAKRDAEALRDHMVINTVGEIWKRVGPDWKRAGTLAYRQDREDFLVSQLSQEDR